LKRLVDYKVNEQEFKHQYKEFADMAIAIAKLDFTRKINVENTKDIFSYIATAMNLLSEELEHRAIPKNYLEQTIEYATEINPDFTILSDSNGKIIAAGVKADSNIGYNASELKGKQVQSLFASDIHYMISEERQFETKEINIFNSKSDLVLVTLYSKELFHDRAETPAYLYMMKEKRG